MHPLEIAIGWAWIAFWIYWLASAASSKQSVRGGRWRQLTGVSVILVFAIAGALRGGSLAVPSVILAAIGAVLFACGIALAVWGRRHLGRNWGMPMTQRAEPELVISGPYRFVRHPIYSGLLTAMLGTALADNLLGLIVVLPPGIPGVQEQDQDAHSVPSVGQRTRSCRAPVSGRALPWSSR